MRIHLISGAVFLGLSGATPAFAEVTVAFVDSDRYLDAGTTPLERKRTNEEVESIFRKLGERYLAAGQTLKIEVLDIDLAGRMRYEGRYPEGVRVMDGRTDRPAFKLRYSLAAGGKAGETRDETVSDPNFMVDPRRPGKYTALFYEQRMLDDWFRERFAKGVESR